jgi:heptosyltransferase-2
MKETGAIKTILFITLSNIGDCLLTLPVLDYLRQGFPQAKITVMVGPRPREVFENNPNIDYYIVYDKHAKLKQKIRLFLELEKQKFDLVVDLRNTLFGIFLSAKYKISSFLSTPKSIKHMKLRHLFKIQSLKFNPQNYLYEKKQCLYIKPADEDYIREILMKNKISTVDSIFVVSPGAKSHIKRWPADNFAGLISNLVEEFKAKVILVGDKDDSEITETIFKGSKYPVLDLSGKTNITQLACLLKKAKVLISNDSAVLHLASYLNIPVVAIFGPTDDAKYGPWSNNSQVVKKEIFCRPCEKAQCRFNTLDCMKLIKVEDVLRQAREILTSNFELRTSNFEYERILIARTDKIGDVLLSTPVIKALRDNLPNAYIAMMISPLTLEIIEGNPYLDEVIIYDKDKEHKSWPGSIKFAANLKKKRFDLAIILHPANRVHLVTFLAGIPKRIGYNRKMGFLLTDRIKHTKQLGEKHESEYNLDFLRYLGMQPKGISFFMPIKPESEEWAVKFLREEGIKETDKLLVVNPGASCPSKIWPAERFAELIDRLIEKYGFKVLIIAGPKDACLAGSVISHMHHPAINTAAKTTLSQLASILKKGELFISNDSGPVHIACALGVPVISIFGRDQKGLSPKRWGPLGKRSAFLHKEVGCIECLAHNCKREFACLKAISVQDVISAVGRVL